jgi:hypothetical protein
MTMIKCSYCSITLQVMRTVFSGGHVSRRQLGGISRIGKFGVAFIPWPESSNVSVWSGPFLWVGVRVMYPHSVMWIHSSGLAGQR